MSVTKRTFDAAANSLAEQFNHSVTLFSEGRIDAAKAANTAVRAIMNDLARHFRSQNPSFDSWRFERAVFGMDRVIGVWHGGASYASYDYRTEMEWFENQEAAKDALRNRYSGRACYEYVYGSGKNGYFDTPGVDHGSYIDLYGYYYDGPEVVTDDMSYARVLFGPRGGVRVESM